MFSHWNALKHNDANIFHLSLLFVTFFQVKGLVKQHIDSFNYFINVEVKPKPTSVFSHVGLG